MSLWPESNGSEPKHPRSSMIGAWLILISLIGLVASIAAPFIIKLWKWALE